MIVAWCMYLLRCAAYIIAPPHDTQGRLLPSWLLDLNPSLVQRGADSHTQRQGCRMFAGSMHACMEGQGRLEFRSK